MSKISPCLWFKDEAEEAASFYVSLVPNSRIVHVQHNTADNPSGKVGSVLMVEFELAGQTFLALNGGMHFEYTHAISFSLACEDQAELDRFWAALLDGGREEQCGWLKDRYGVSWQIVPAILPKLLADPDKDKSRRVMEAVLRMVKLDIAALEKAHRGE